MAPYALFSAAVATDAVALTAEITALGYRGSAKTVRRYLQTLRSQPLGSGQTATPRPPTPPTAREVTGWLTRHSDSLTDDERATRDAVLDRSPALRATGDLVSEFAQILTQRRGHELRDWMQRFDTDAAQVPVGAGNSVTSRDLQILVQEAAEAVSSQRPDCRAGGRRSAACGGAET
jgi:hypothetical protein